MVGFSDTENHAGAVGSVLAHHRVRAWPDGAGSRCLSAGGLVPQELSDLRRCSRALVRKELWAQETFRESSWEIDTIKVPRAFIERLTDALCYAA